jgi:NAD(P)-dependent dehydrogenase (short-subunit alcohol dehydrogenase family)
MIAPFLPPGVDPARVAEVEPAVLRAGRSHAERVQDVARAILFLACEESASCSGTELAVDGGYSAGKVIPGAPGAPRPSRSR